MAQVLSFQITVRDDGSAVLRRFTGALEQTGAVATRLSSSFDRFALRVAGVNQAFEVVRHAFELGRSAFEKFIEPIVSSGNELLQLSRRFGSTISDINALSHIANIAGANLAGMTQGLRTLNIQLADVHQPGSQAAETLAALGIEGEGLNAFLKLDTAAKFRTLIDAFAEFQDTPTRFRAGVVLFGRSFAELNQVINTGTTETRESLLKFANEFGLNLDEQTALAAEHIKTSLHKVEIATQGIFRRIIGADTLDAIANALAASAEGIGRFAKSIPQATFDAFGTVLIRLATASVSLTEALAKAAVSPPVIRSFELLASAIQSVANAIDALARKNVGQITRDAGAAAADALRTATPFGILSDLVNAPSRLLFGKTGAEMFAARRRAAFVGPPVPPAALSPETQTAIALHQGPEFTREEERAQASFATLPVSEAASFTKNRQPLPVFPHVPDAAEIAKVASFQQKLMELRREVEAGPDPLRQFQAGIQKTVDEMLKGVPGADAFRGALTSLLTETKQNEALTAATDKVQDLEDALRVLRDPAQAADVEVEQLARTFERLGITLDGSAPQFDAVLERLRAVKEATQAKGIADFGHDLSNQFQEALNPATALAHEMDALRKKAREVGAKDSLDPLIAQLEEAKRTAGAFFDVFGALEKGAADVFDALIAGTRSVSDAFEGLKLSIIKSLADAFIEGLKKKVGFETAFKVNIVQFLGNIGGLLRGQTQGGGFGGVVQQLIGGVFGGGAGGGGTGTLGSFFGGGTGGGTTTVGTGAGGTGIPNIPTGGLGNRLLQFLGLGPTTATTGLGATATSFPGTFGFSTGQFGAGASFESGVVAVGPETTVGTSLASNFASFVAIIGSLASLALTAKAAADSVGAFRKGTLNAPESTTFAASTGVGVGAGAIGGGIAGGAIAGAVAGAPLAPFTLGLSVLVGAAIGAAIAEAIGQAIGSAVTKGVSDATKHGLTQEQLNTKVTDNKLLQILLPGLGHVGVANDIFAGLFVPNIETIFDKILRQILEKSGAGLRVNRELKEPPKPAALAKLSPETRTDTRTIARLLAGVTGAGTEQETRVARFQNIILNSAQAQGKSSDQIEKMTLIITRFLSSNRFTGGLRLVDALLGRQKDFTTPPAPVALPAQGVAVEALTDQIAALTKVFQAGPGAGLKATREAESRKGIELVTKAFQPGVPGADLAKVARVFEEGKITAHPTALKESRKAIGEAIPALFSGPDVETGLQAFAGKLSEIVRSAFVQGISKALLTTFLGDILTETFADFNKQLRKGLKAGGISEKEQADLRGKLTKDAEGLATTLAEALKFLPDIIRLEKRAEEIIDTATTRALANAGDIEAARARILARPDFQKAVQVRDITRDLAEAITARAAVAKAGGGFEGEAAQVQVTRRQAAASKTRFNDFIASLGGLEKALQPDNIERSTQLLKEYTDLQLSALEQGLNLARQQKAAYEQLTKFADGLRESVDVLRRGPAAQVDILQRRKAEAVTQFAAFQAAKTNVDRLKAGSELSRILPEILQLGQQLLAPGTAEFGNVLDFVDQIGAALQEAGIKYTSAFDASIQTLTAALDLFVKDIQPVADAFAQAGLLNLQAEFIRINLLLDDGGPIHTVLQSIAAQLGVQAPVAAAGIPPPTANLGDQPPPGPGGTAGTISAGGHPIGISLQRQNPKGGGAGGYATARGPVIQELNEALGIFTNIISSDRAEGQVEGAATALARTLERDLTLLGVDKFDARVIKLIEAARGYTFAKFFDVSHALQKIVEVVPGAERGALVTRETVLRVGEHGKKEAVLPLQSPSALRAVGDAIATAQTARLVPSVTTREFRNLQREILRTIQTKQQTTILKDTAPSIATRELRSLEHDTSRMIETKGRQTNVLKDAAPSVTTRELRNLQRDTLRTVQTNRQVVPGAERGALVTHETMLRVGERGKKEAVLPLQSPSALRAVGDAIAAAQTARLVPSVTTRELRSLQRDMLRTIQTSKQQTTVVKDATPSVTTREVRSLQRDALRTIQTNRQQTNVLKDVTRLTRQERLRAPRADRQIGGAIASAVTQSAALAAPVTPTRVTVPSASAAPAVHITMGDITIQVQGSTGDPQRTAQDVATALRLRLSSELTREIERIAG